MKHIRMPKEMADKWLDWLENERLPQGIKRLECDGKYCCLAVLQMVVQGYVERLPDGTAFALPSPSWLKENGIVFIDIDGQPDDDPHLPNLETSASNANDIGRTFPEIAAAIRDTLEVY